MSDMPDEKGIDSPHKDFERIKKIDENGVEYWEARELMVLLDYAQWRNFEEVINKAKQSCFNSGQPVENHFAEVSKSIKSGYNTTREVTNWKLDRYACYLVAQNGDARKKPVALAQTYFAIQARKQEILPLLTDDQKRMLIRDEITGENKKLSATAQKAGVKNFGVFHDAGYRGLYGMPSRDVKEYKGITDGNLLDWVGSAELAANLFRITQTDEKIKKEKIQGENPASEAHRDVGRKVRDTMKEIHGTAPEDLPVNEHIKEVKKRVEPLIEGDGRTQKLIE
jgi:DNA-damage-inducible protein D